MEKVGIIGVGRLGLSFALLCEHKGYEVYGYDNREDHIKSLNDKSYKTTEPNVEFLLRKSKNFIATSDLNEVLKNTDTIFIFVPTPSKKDGSYDHSYVDEVIENIKNSGITIDNKLIVVGCTVMPGYTESKRIELIPFGADIAYNPEFIAQGSILNGLQMADMVLIGLGNNNHLKRLTNLYTRIMDIEAYFNVMSTTSAEITKIAINCFLTTKIAYANMIGEIAINSGVGMEIPKILKAIGNDSRIGNKYLQFGFGFGGPCLPRDNRALGNHSQMVGVFPGICKISDAMNEDHADYLRDFYIKRNIDKKPFIFNQLTYKKGVEMLTESQQYRLCKDLLKAGFSVDIIESEQVVASIKEELPEYLDRITFNTCQDGFKIEL